MGVCARIFHQKNVPSWPKVPETRTNVVKLEVDLGLPKISGGVSPALQKVYDPPKKKCTTPQKCTTPLTVRTFPI
jgi:hypothetical protein